MKEKEIAHRVLQRVRPYLNRLVWAMLSMVVVAILSSGQAYMVKPLLDEIFFNRDHSMLNILPLLLILLFLVKGLFVYSYSYLMERVGQYVVRDFRGKLYEHFQKLPVSFFDKTPTGELISRIINDVSIIQAAVSSSVVAMLKDFFQIIGLMGVIFYQNWKLALFTMIFLPLAIIPIVYFGKKYRKLSTQSQEHNAKLANHLHETITGQRVIKAFCAEEYEISRFYKTIDRLLSITIRDAQQRSISRPLMEFIGGLGIALIIWYGGREVLEGKATPGTFFSFLTALIMLYEPIKSVSNLNNPLQKGFAAAERIFTVLDIAPDIKDTPNAVQLSGFKKEIEFNDVSFSYEIGDPVLKNINLRLRAGEMIALVGASGSGKTTLANLLPRFYEIDSGKIIIDGHDIKSVTIKSLRRQLAIVSQQTILFNDTIRNNIAYGCSDCLDTDIVAAARAAYALEFVQQLPDGFDTVIGESGSRLSGGQQQRIAIARALLKNAPILILDEATSSLDVESEREVQRALENLMKNRTTLVIAHRLSTIKKADRIIVMQHGKIVEEGAHDDLLRQKGVYEMLYNIQ